MKRSFIALIVAMVAIVAMTSAQKSNKPMESEKRTIVRLETTKGDIEIALYNETPGHRDNFVKNVEAGAYDGVIFHRVINDFMIQTGDPKSKEAVKGQMYGSSDFGSEIPAEFVYPKYFHKKGAVAAARIGDRQNPERKSSGSQFYIVTGKVFNDQALAQLEHSKTNRRKNNYFDGLVSQNREQIMQLRRNRDSLALQELQQQLIQQTEAAITGKEDLFTPEQRQAYTTVGGTPHLDGEYTVYGEVVKGLDVVDSIQAVKTDGNDRPLEDVKVLKAVILQRADK
ncbi:MAG: peptidylprolyl isomerase [Bacteroidales bacterium]|nr:peptidylprolyl isomerase [Bacteroidales bacterium]